jgi:hypothetical protein
MIKSSFYISIKNAKSVKEQEEKKKATETVVSIAIKMNIATTINNYSKIELPTCDVL